jgi:exonuclease III
MRPSLALTLLLAVAAHAQPITLDGEFSDWPADTGAIADGDYVYVRTAIDGPARTLQDMGDRTLELWIDVDSSTATGATEPAPRAAAALGVDLEVRFSPRAADSIESGVAVAVPLPGGDRLRLGHADAGVMFLPTYASPEYEIRISRHTREVPGGPKGGALAGTGRATIMLALLDARGGVKGWSDPFTVDLPAVSGATPRTDRIPPSKGEGELRVMTWNILKSAPSRNPSPFARTIKALAPDIILFQEWGEADRDQIGAWLGEHIGGEWNVVKSADGDVAIASTSPLNAVGPARIRSGDDQHPVRFVAATAATPIGPVIAATAHLKCCGSIGSDEDARRLAEGAAINEAMRSAFSEGAGAAVMRVMGGDMNLVGSRPPLDILRAGLDADGSDLDVVDAMVWGDRALYTWSDASNGFSPGRLDYLTAGAAALEVVRSFVLDASILSDSALRDLGLEPGEVASDHLPVVVDVRPR